MAVPSNEPYRANRVYFSAQYNMFLVPAVSGEKVALCLSLFLTLAVFLTTITTFMPESSDEISVLGIYV